MRNTAGRQGTISTERTHLQPSHSSMSFGETGEALELQFNQRAIGARLPVNSTYANQASAGIPIDQRFFVFNFILLRVQGPLFGLKKDNQTL
jgi:hypothetical protein